jgi:hypothetical protein
MQKRAEEGLRKKKKLRRTKEATNRKNKNTKGKLRE